MHDGWIDPDGVYIMIEGPGPHLQGIPVLCAIACT